MSKALEQVYLPEPRPDGWVLCHNHVRPRPNTAQGVRGFRAFYTPQPPDGFVPCDCGWKPKLGPHYASARHVKAVHA